MLKKSLVLLVSMTLISCSSAPKLVVVHEPLGCLGQPYMPQSTELTPQEFLDTPDSVKMKLREKIIRLRTRIDKQCELNREHDGLHDEQGQ